MVDINRKIVHPRPRQGKRYHSESNFLIYDRRDLCVVLYLGSNELADFSKRGAWILFLNVPSHLISKQLETCYVVLLLFLVNSNPPVDIQKLFVLFYKLNS